MSPAILHQLDRHSVGLGFPVILTTMGNLHPISLVKENNNGHFNHNQLECTHGLKTKNITPKMREYLKNISSEIVKANMNNNLIQLNIS